MVISSQEHPLRRGSAPDLPEIVAAAVALADREGLEAVSLRRVATALRSGTASFYRVLDSREALLDRMVDAGSSAGTRPRRKRRESGARTWPPWPATGAPCSTHPWLGAELAGRPAIGPNALMDTNGPSQRPPATRTTRPPPAAP